MVNMDIKLDTWKNKLLDMGKRNRLLNYRDTRRSNLRIKLPGIYDLWDSFVVNEHPLEFPFVDEEQQLSLEEESRDFIAEAGSVQTNQSIKEQQRTLRNLRSKAKTFMEEQGVNVLYLSFGFLRWTESDHSKVHFDAPLILVPVSLSWESITSPFVLSLHEDEIIVNPTLAFKLDNDFGIKLPEDNALGRLSNEQFVFLTSGYEDEKRELTKRAAELKKEIDTAAERSADVKRFVALVRRYTEISELTYENVHEFIDRILVYELDKNTNTRKIEIFYSFVGKVDTGDQPTESVSYFRQIGADVKSVVV